MKVLKKYQAAVFFIVFALYEELFIRFYDQENPFVNSVWFIMLSSIVFGCILFFIVSIIPNKKVSRWVAGVAIFLFTAYACIQHCCMNFYMSYFGVSIMKSMAGQVVGDFADTLWFVIETNIVSILVGCIPFILYCIFAKKIVTDESKSYGVKPAIIVLVIAVCAQAGISVIGHNGPDKAIYTYEFDVNDSLPTVGLGNALRLELQYAVFGKPEIPLDIIDEQEAGAEGQTESSGSAIEEKERRYEREEKTYEVGEQNPYMYDSVSGMNQFFIDFNSMIENTTDKTLLSMHKYFKSLRATNKNEYTGIYEGKNLVMICCEAFSPYFISEELTPALYRLQQEGFRFSNFYQPLTGQSTSGGEYEMLVGNIPGKVTNSDGVARLAMAGSFDRYLPFAMANELNAYGYKSLAWHDNPDSVYERNRSHPNLGYEFHGTTTMAKKMSGAGWKSDLEMLQLTAHDYIDAYVNDGTPFNVYYMSVSGHASYSWNHAMAKKNQDVAMAAFPDVSMETQAYVAASLEIEYALEYLLDELEKAGILEDTVICMTADHYPYVLLRSDHYHEISGYPDTESPTDTYRNALILWCGDGSGNVDVDTPCTAIDILPTLLNMFGIDYDSRLITGRDIFATNYVPYKVSSNMPIAIIRTSTGYSWRTDAGVYETNTKTFTPYEGITVDEDYVDQVNKLVSNKKNYAELILTEDYYRKIFTVTENNEGEE